MVDVFHEVDELVRSDHYATLLRRIVPWVVGVVVLALLGAFGVWGYLRYQQASAHKASVFYGQGVDALTRADFGGAYAAFAQAAKEPAAGYRSLALMQEAGIRVDQKRPDEAVALFDQAAKAAPNPVLGDAARLKAALTLMDEGRLDAVADRLKPLTDSKRPYAALAREALAMDELQTGQINAARSQFVVLSLMEEAPDDVRQRARLMMNVIDGGGPHDLGAIIAAARALPPPPPTEDLGPPQGAPAAGGQDSQTPPAGAAQ